MTPEMGAFSRHCPESVLVHPNQDYRMRKTRRRYDDRFATGKLLKFFSIQGNSAVDNCPLIGDSGCTANSPA